MSELFDAKKFAKIFEDIGPSLERMFENKLRRGSGHDPAITADDLLQKTFERAWIYRFGCPEGVNATRWMFGIARNVFVDACRKHDGHSARHISLEDVFWDEVVLFPRQEMRLVQAEVLSLVALWAREASASETNRTAFWMRMIEGSPFSEIAGALGQSENTLRVAVFRIVKRLRARAVTADTVRW